MCCYWEANRHQSSQLDILSPLLIKGIFNLSPLIYQSQIILAHMQISEMYRRQTKSWKSKLISFFGGGRVMHVFKLGKGGPSLDCKSESKENSSRVRIHCDGKFSIGDFLPSLFLLFRKKESRISTPQLRVTLDVWSRYPHLESAGITDE